MSETTTTCRGGTVHLVTTPNRKTSTLTIEQDMSDLRGMYRHIVEFTIPKHHRDYDALRAIIDHYISDLPAMIAMLAMNPTYRVKRFDLRYK